MASRLNLHKEFCEILNSKNAYFQPPSSVSMKYPCIRYKKSSPSINHADDKVYKLVNCYEGVVIDYDPDSKIPDTILEHFEMCSLGRPYSADNLNHFPFTLYY